MARNTDRAVVNTDAKPTIRQVYAMAHALVDIAGLSWPETRGEMSDLLKKLSEQRDAVNADVVDAF